MGCRTSSCRRRGATSFEAHAGRGDGGSARRCGQALSKRPSPLVEALCVQERAWRERPLVRSLYEEWYRAIAHRLSTVPGDSVELGSGISTLQRICPAVVPTDVEPTPWASEVVDAEALPLRGRVAREPRARRRLPPSCATGPRSSTRRCAPSRRAAASSSSIHTARPSRRARTGASITSGPICRPTRSPTTRRSPSEPARVQPGAGDARVLPPRRRTERRWPGFGSSSGDGWRCSPIRSQAGSRGVSSSPPLGTRVGSGSNAARLPRAALRVSLPGRPRAPPSASEAHDLDTELPEREERHPQEQQIRGATG